MSRTRILRVILLFAALVLLLGLSGPTLSLGIPALSGKPAWTVNPASTPFWWKSEWLSESPPTSGPAPSQIREVMKKEEAPYRHFLFSIGAQAPVGEFNYPHDVAVAPNGTVYVADTNNHRIQYFSPTGTFLGTWGSHGFGEGQFNRPHGVVVAPNGTVYVVDSDNHRIQYFSSTGQFLGKWGSSGDGNGEFRFPYFMTIAGDGTTYVSDSGNHRVQHFSRTGAFLGKWGGWGSGEGQFKFPHGILAFDDTIYVADADNFRIQRFSTTGTFLGAWGSRGSGNGQFNQPIGIARASDGTIYVTDRYNHRIQRFSTTGTFLGKWGSSGSGEGQFDQPTGIAIAPDGTVYVADSLNGRIQRFSATGQFLETWGSWGRNDGRFWEAVSVAVDSTGNIYVADRWNHRIQKFDPDGRFVRQWGHDFYGPRGVAVDSAGNIYVADSGNHRIQKFTSDGVFLTEWGSYGDGNGEFKEPIGVAVGPDNTVYVADSENHRIQRFSATGQFLGKWGTQGEGDGQFNFPHDVAVAPDGTVYVADSRNHRIQRFSRTGQFLGKWGSLGSGNGQFNWPHGVAVASDGTVYVADMNNHRVQHFSATGAFLGKWGHFGGGDGQFNLPTSVAVGPDGTVYVAEAWGNRVQAFGTAYPDTWRGEYFVNRWLAERPVLIRNEQKIDFDWGYQSPGPGIPIDNFSVRWQRYVWFESGVYRFTISVDDGIRLWIGDRLLIDQWQEQATIYNADISLSSGYHRVRLEYFEASGRAAVHLTWEPLGPEFHATYLPLIQRSLALTPPPTPTLPVCDGGFEAGRFEPCWQHGGELPANLVSELYNGELPHTGHYSALLGNPRWGVGWPTPIPAGSGWIEQRIAVPNTSNPRLTFFYRIVSYDIMQGTRLWDTLDVTINGITNVVFRDGSDRPPANQGTLYDSGWKLGAVDLSPWRGQEVLLRFAVWNREYDPRDGMDYYNTWAYIDQVEVK